MAQQHPRAEARERLYLNIIKQRFPKRHARYAHLDALATPNKAREVEKTACSDSCLDIVNTPSHSIRLSIYRNTPSCPIVSYTSGNLALMDELLQEREQVKKFFICVVVEPAFDGDAVVDLSSTGKK